MANRHLSRSIVLQTLFEWDFISTKNLKEFNDENIKETLDRNLERFGPGLDDNKFSRNLLNLIFEKKEAVDEIITTAAPDWPLDKISVVDRNILRIGLTELLFGDRKDVPPKVAINEAIELAKTFGGDNSSKFVNGVLGTVYKEIGQPDKDQQSKNKKGKEEVDISKLPKEELGGALVYSINKGQIYLGLVHDVFGYWTLSKGRIEEGEDLREGTMREVKEEIGIDINIIEELGENEYVATHPEKGKLLKHVTYFLAESEYKELELEETGGLDEAKWFTLKEIPELRIYKDIVPLLTKAIEIISNKNNNS